MQVNLVDLLLAIGTSFMQLIQLGNIISKEIHFMSFGEYISSLFFFPFLHAFSNGVAKKQERKENKAIDAVKNNDKARSSRYQF